MATPHPIGCPRPCGTQALGSSGRSLCHQWACQGMAGSLHGEKYSRRPVISTITLAHLSGATEPGSRRVKTGGRGICRSQKGVREPEGPAQPLDPDSPDDPLQGIAFALALSSSKMDILTLGHDRDLHSLERTHPLYQIDLGSNPRPITG